jgi:hypothetical protein
MMDRQTGMKMSQETARDKDRLGRYDGSVRYSALSEMCGNGEGAMRSGVECWKVRGPVWESINRGGEGVVHIVISERNIES